MPTKIEVGVAILVFCCSFVILYEHYKSKPILGYDCQFVEVNPDVPQSYKDACRKARMFRY